MKFFFSGLVIASILQGSGAVNLSDEKEGAKMRANLREGRNLGLRHHGVPHQWQPRIVGGQDAQDGEYDFFVQGAGCGASLIASDMVLTAAHCAGYIANNNNQVLVGGAREWDTVTPNSQWANVAEEISHPDYDGDVFKDYMLVKLSSPITNPNIGTVGLAGDSTSLNVGDTLTVIGFGALSEGGASSDILQEVNVNYVSPSTCNSVYGGGFDPNFMFCAGVQGGGKDSCQGDSGGPIFKDGYQIGIVSWGDGCARAGVPGVYATVSAEIEWIKEVVCDKSVDKPDWACSGGTNPVPPGNIGSSPGPAPGPGPSPPAPSPPAPSPPVPSPPVPSPPVPSPSPGLEYVVFIAYDLFPEETGVSIYEVSSGAEIFNLPAYSVYDPYAFEFAELSLVPGEEYELVITDTYGDGMPDDDCSDDWIDTFVAVDAFDGDEWVDELAFVDGCELWDYLSVTFTVPSVRTATSKTAARKGIKRTKANFCNDSHDTFLFKGIEKDCHWLQATLPKSEKFCSRKDISTACPSTCGTCNQS